MNGAKVNSKVLLFCIVFFSLLLSGDELSKPYQAVKGVLDLREWDFQKDGVIYLNGEWSFHWEKFIDPSKSNIGATNNFIVVPGSWRGHIVGSVELPGQGYASYQLKVMLPEVKPLAVKIMTIGTAFTLFADGKKIVSVGKVSEDEDIAESKFKPTIVEIKPESTELLLTLHVSNYNEKNAGPWDPLLLGKIEQLDKIRTNNFVILLSIFGAFLFMSMYHFWLFLFWRKDLTTLLFTAASFLVASRVGFTGDERFLTQLFDIPFWLVVKVEFLSYYLGFPAVISFIVLYFKESFNLKIFKILITIFVLFSIVVVVAKPLYFTATLPFYHVISLSTCLYVIWVLVELVFKKSIDALIFLSGFFLFCFLSVIEILKSIQLISFGYVSGIGFFIFLFAQAIMLALKFTRSFRKVEKLSHELTDNNIVLKAEIFDRIEAENKLQQTKDYLHNLIDSLNSAIISVDQLITITHLNKEAEALFSLNKKNATGMLLSDVCTSLRKYEQNIERVFQTGTSQEFLRKRLDIDPEAYYNISIFPLLYGDDQEVIVRIDDVTELEKKDSQLVQIQKMETVGNLAGGLAHDFNNVLSGITGSVSLMSYYVESEEKDIGELREDIQLIEASLKRASDMVRQLMAISRRNEMSLTPINLNHAVKHVVKICNNSFSKSIKILTHFSAIPPITYADPTQIEQVILNLCVNASHAMTIMRSENEKKGGTLTVEIRRENVEEALSSLYPDADNGFYWVVRVTDTGIGMDQETQDKIFEPFFTTKEKGKGTGLGLAMVFNIIKKHEGFLTVDSAKGKGTTFSAYFKVLETEHEVEKNSARKEMITKGSGTILIIDDEKLVRDTAERMLFQLGYFILKASNGDEGIDMFREYQKVIKVVLLDTSMPETPGKAILLKMKAIAPHIPVIMMSGLEDQNVIDDLENAGSNGFLRKPYTLQSLGKIVGKVMLRKQE